MCSEWHWCWVEASDLIFSLSHLQPPILAFIEILNLNFNLPFAYQGMTLFCILTARWTNSYYKVTMFISWFPWMLILCLWHLFSTIWHMHYFWTTNERSFVLSFSCWDFLIHVWENSWFQGVHPLPLLMLSITLSSGSKLKGGVYNNLLWCNFH